MRPDLDRLRRIEYHLLEPTSPVAADCLALDATLPADIEAQRRVYEALRQAGRRQLRQELVAIHEQLYGREAGRWSWAAAADGLRLVFVRWARGKF